MTTRITTQALTRITVARTRTATTTINTRFFLTRPSLVQRRTGGAHAACYSSLRRPRSLGSSGGRITARTTAQSRVAQPHNHHGPKSTTPIAAAAGSTLESAATSSSTVEPTQESPSDIVEGLDIAATPAVIPEDPFGVLQPYDTAAKVLSQPALIMTRQIEMMN
ncbi:hypothetical protein BGZ83_003734, partial [Gryganskiella cystojenkinii]